MPMHFCAEFHTVGHVRLLLKGGGSRHAQLKLLYTDVALSTSLLLLAGISADPARMILGLDLQTCSRRPPAWLCQAASTPE